MRKFKCSICGYLYSESAGVPEKGIASGTRWEDLPDGFVCPLCSAPKSMFQPVEEAGQKPTPAGTSGELQATGIDVLSPGELSAICSSLAKGCEKQRLAAEMEAFFTLADYYKSKTSAENGKSLDDALKMLEDDIDSGFSAANGPAKAEADRGALRALVWSEKVSLMMKALLDRFGKEGGAMLSDTKIFVCDICGFTYTGAVPPEICPVCKVPSFKISQMERR